MQCAYVQDGLTSYYLCSAESTHAHIIRTHKANQCAYVQEGLAGGPVVDVLDDALLDKVLELVGPAVRLLQVRNALGRDQEQRLQHIDRISYECASARGEEEGEARGKRRRGRRGEGKERGKRIWESSPRTQITSKGNSSQRERVRDKGEGKNGREKIHREESEDTKQRHTRSGGNSMYGGSPSAISMIMMPSDQMSTCARLISERPTSYENSACACACVCVCVCIRRRSVII